MPCKAFLYPQWHVIAKLCICVEFDVLVKCGFICGVSLNESTLHSTPIPSPLDMCAENWFLEGVYLGSFFISPIMCAELLVSLMCAEICDKYYLLFVTKRSGV